MTENLRSLMTFISDFLFSASKTLQKGWKLPFFFSRLLKQIRKESEDAKEGVNENGSKGISMKGEFRLLNEVNKFA
jgi:hypothetical protein